MVSSVTAEEALDRLKPNERGWVQAFRDQLRSELGPRVRDIRLFGSRVRGDYHEESDIDVLVLVEDGDFEAYERAGEIARGISSWLSPVVYEFEEYHSPSSRASGFYKEVRNESVRL